MAHWVIETKSLAEPEWKFYTTVMVEDEAERIMTLLVKTYFPVIPGFTVNKRLIDNTIKFVTIILTETDEVEGVVGPFDTRADAQHYGDKAAISVNHYIVRMLVGPGVE